MFYILNYQDLIPGDIILDRDNTRQSQIIRQAIHGEYSHARLYVGGTIIEASGLGVQSVNPQRIIYDNPDDALVLRHPKASKEQLELVCLFARSECGKEFSARDAKKRTTTDVEEPNREFCSRLVALSYEKAKCPICPNPALCNPENIRQSPMLEVIPNMTHMATPQEIEIADSDGYLKMENETNLVALLWGDLLQKMRNASRDSACDIQTETQLAQYVITYPNCDSIFVKILRESEYFRIWKCYEDANPWEFDAQKFIVKYGVSAKQCARQLLSLPTPILIWRYQYTTYTNYVKEYNLELFKAFQEMYSNILDWHRRRMNALQMVIQC